MEIATSSKKEFAKEQYSWALHRLFVIFTVLFLSVASLFLYLGLPQNKYSVSLWVPVMTLLALSAGMVLFRKNLIVTNNYIEERRGFIGISQKSLRYKVSDFSSILIDTHCLTIPQHEFGSATKAIYVYLVPKDGRPEIAIEVYAAGFGVDEETLKSKIKFAKAINRMTGLRIKYSESIRQRFGNLISRGDI